MTEDEINKQLNDVAASIDGAINRFVPMHEIFEQMLAGGFTENQACKIIGTWIATRS